MKKKYKFAVLAAAVVVGLSACGEKTKETISIPSSAQEQERQTEIKIETTENQQAAKGETAALSGSETAETENTMEMSLKSNETQTTAANAAYPDEYQNYAGRWINTESSRCSMEIHSNGDGTYAIEITWSNSAAEYYKWNMTGTPSQKRRGGGLDYTDGVRTLVTFQNENTSQSKVEATGEQGNFFLNEIGIMHWTDPAENEGEPVEFAYDDGNFDTATTDDNYIIEGSDTRKLTESEISGLTKDELRLARNEIYARHGLMFQAEDLQEYFGRQSWYNPTIPAGQFDENILNSYEKENLQLLQKLENRK